MDLVQQNWYSWGAFLACAFALFTGLWVFFDAQRRELDAVAWKMTAVFAVVLIAPSVIIAAVPEFRISLSYALQPLAVLGIAATVLALFALLLHIAGIGTGSGIRCANCRRRRDPSWTYCPYCEYDKPASTVSQFPVYSPAGPPIPPPHPIQTFAPPPPEISSDPTMHLNSATEYIPPKPDTGGTRILQVQKSQAHLAYLVLRAGTHEGKTFQLNDSITIGRFGEPNDIVLDDDSVSREHARVRFTDGKFVITDLGSSNGTFVQDAKTKDWKKIQQRILTNGMMLKLGESILSFMEIKDSPPDGE